MRKLALALPAAVAAVLVAVAMSVGSSHREAPNTALDPTADDTDVYAYTANELRFRVSVRNANSYRTSYLPSPVLSTLM